MRSVTKAASLILGLAISLAPAPLAAQDKQNAPKSAATSSAPWYADKLRALGFAVFKKPVPMPDFSVPPLSGGAPVSLSSMRGKVVLVNFWATWCPPCKKEMPSIEKLWQSMRDKPFVFMAISEGEAKSTVSPFIAANRYTFPVYLDQEGAIGSQFAVDGIPTTFVVDKAGNAIARVVGSTEYATPEALAFFAELASRGVDGK